VRRTGAKSITPDSYLRLSNLPACGISLVPAQGKYRIADRFHIQLAPLGMEAGKTPHVTKITKERRQQKMRTKTKIKAGLIIVVC
jgi:hypothetical protein